jgi:hypothetical protein
MLVLKLRAGHVRMAGSFCVYSRLATWEGRKTAPATMRRLLSLLFGVAVLLASLAGCGGGDKEKGINSNKDRPKAADKSE